MGHSGACGDMKCVKCTTRREQYLSSVVLIYERFLSFEILVMES